MTSVQSINVGLGLSEYSAEATTPTTPRAPIPPPVRPPPPISSEGSASSVPTTPTTLNFNGINGQRPLPTSPFQNSFSSPPQPASGKNSPSISRGDSQRSIKSDASQDVEMQESDGEGDGSEGEGVDPETGSMSKKKKGQRFFCTGFDNCKLSFTRSEHLARHIRYEILSVC